ncbi:MAG: choice-of-anchor D domain-containing protein [Salibacteraceae bacterium]
MKSSPIIMQQQGKNNPFGYAKAAIMERAMENKKRNLFRSALRMGVWLTLCLALMAVGLQGAKAATVYVDLNATGANNGTSWGNAFTNLSDAIFNATSGDDIWIATGTYYPDRTTIAATAGTLNNQANTFEIKDGVDLFGGFAGTETTLAQRNIIANPTILSGDLGVAGTITDNAYHVVTLQVFSTLETFDGLTISDGYALAHPTLNQRGGGAFYQTNVGAGIVLMNCRINNNYGGLSGFASGGAIYIGSGLVTMTSCIVENNVATQSGCISVGAGTTGLFSKNVFQNTSGTVGGGAYHGENGADPIFENCLFANNTATSGGAALDASGASRIKAVNCTFYNNKTNGGGPAINRLDASNAYVTNCIFLNNGAAPIGSLIGSPTYSNFFGDGVGLIAGTGNLNVDPLLNDPTHVIGPDSIYGTNDDGLRPSGCGSPVVDAGTATGAPSVDFINTARPIGAGIDLGAYENTGVTSAEIAIQGLSTTIVDGDNTPDVSDNTHFGNTSTASPTVHTYTIQNSGSTALLVADILSSGLSGADFIVGGITLPATISASDSTTFTVSYSPTVAGTDVATITVYNNDCDEGFYDFAVQGTATVPPLQNGLDMEQNQYGNVSAPANLPIGNTPYSIELWLRPEFNTIMGVMAWGVNSGNQATAIETRTNVIRHYWWGNDVDITVGDITGSWHHYACTYDGTARRVYFDGVLVATKVGSLRNVPAGTDLKVGFGLVSGGFDGQMDEFRIWDHARSCAEIEAYKDIELSGAETGLVTYYNFNQGTAGGNNTGVDSIIDLSPNGYHATLLNFTGLEGSQNGGLSSNWIDAAGNGVTTGIPLTFPEIHVLGNTVSIADGDLSPDVADNTDFGAVASATKTYTIANVGTADLTLTNLASTGTNSSEFVVGGLTFPLILSAGADTTFTVTFTAAAVGTRTATISINNNDCDEDPYTFSVQASPADVTPPTFTCPTNFTQNTDAGLCGVNVNLTEPVVTDNADLVHQNAGDYSLHFENFDYLNLPNLPFLNNAAQFTFESWVKAPSTGEDGLFSVAGDNFYSSTNGGRVRARLVVGGTQFNVSTSCQPIKSDTAFHLALVFDGAQPTAEERLKIYVNGNNYPWSFMSGTDIPTQMPDFGTGSAQLGWSGNGCCYFNDGFMDDTRIWSTARTQAEIIAGLPIEMNGNETGLEVYYDYNVGTPGGSNTGLSSIPDQTGNGYDASLVNFGLTGTTGNIVAEKVERGTVQFSGVGVDGPCFYPVGTTAVTASANDLAGNTATCIYNVTVNDNQNPVPHVSNLPDTTAECRIDSLPAPTASDNCNDTIIATHNATLPITTIGTTVVTWSYSDGNGNMATQNQNVIITDATNPVPDLSSLSDITAVCSVTSLTAPTGTDNCNDTITATHNASLPITAQGTTVVVWTYDDGNGNTVMQNQNVIITDTTNPVPDVTNLSDVTAECTVTALTPPTATDNCAGAITATHNASLPITTQGTNVVVWTYDDGNGNTVIQNQNVVINDVTVPVPDVTNLSDVTSECTVTALTAPTATDNCAGAISATHNASLPITAQGTTVVIWTYDDGNGNTVNQKQNVVINDVTAPVPDVTNLSDVTADCAVPALPAPTATDNCAGSLTATHNASLPITAQGTTVVVWTYDEGNSNTVKQNQNVVINDTTAPVPDVSSIREVTASFEVNTITPPTATEKCAG